MTPDVWRSEMAGFLEQNQASILAAFPGIEISHLTAYGTPTPHVAFRTGRHFLTGTSIRTSKGSIAAADVITKEMEHCQRSGADRRHVGIWSLNSLFGYFDRVHAAGKRIDMSEYAPRPAGPAGVRAGRVLSHFPNGGDRYGDRSTTPTTTGGLVSMSIWATRIARVPTTTADCFNAIFTGGVVLLNEPDGCSGNS